MTRKPASSTPSKPITPHDKNLCGELDSLLARLSMSAAEFAKIAGISDTIISPWRKGKYAGDVAAVETKILATMKRLRISGRLQKQIVETPLTKFVSGVASRLTHAGLVGMIHGRHGIGKTCAAMAFSVADPTAVLIQATRWNATVHGVERMLMENFSIPLWQKSGKCRGDFIAEKVAGTRRLLIVDSADNLTVSAKNWLLDLAAISGSPLLFICGPTATPERHEFLADERAFNAVSMSLEILLTPSDNSAIASAVFSSRPEWLPSLTAITASHSLARAVAVEALASDLVRTGERSDAALEKSAISCLCSPATTEIAMLPA